jgi:uncharacterized protein
LSTMQTATLMRIFVDEEERYQKKPLFMAIIDELCSRGFDGATVLKGIEGFGAHQIIHSMRPIDVATSLPVLIEVAETEEKIRDVIPKLREMIPEGLITLERIQMRVLFSKA